MPTWAQPDAGESLPELLARALAQDPQVRVARALLRASEQRRVQARSRLYPSASLSGTRGEAQEVEFATAIDRRTDRAEAGLRWNLYNYGNDAAELDGTTRDLRAAGQELRQAYEDAAQRIGEAYAERLRAQELLPRSQARLEAVRRLVLQVQRQAEAGKLAEAELQQARNAQLDAEIAHEQLVADEAGARARLSAWLGPLPQPATSRGWPEEVPAAGASARASAAAERAAAARTRVRPPWSVYAPRVDLEYRRSLSDRTTPRATTEQQQGWLLTARWDLPLGGENQARRNEGERRAEAAEAEAERVRTELQAERDALAPRIAAARQALVQIDRQLEQYPALLRAAELQFEAGRRSLQQLIQLHEARFGAEQRRAEQLWRLQTALLRQALLGGGLLATLGIGAVE